MALSGTTIALVEICREPWSWTDIGIEIGVRVDDYQFVMKCSQALADALVEAADEVDSLEYQADPPTS